MLQRGIVPGLEPIRQVQTQRDCLGLRPDPGEGIPRRVAGIATTDSRRQWRIAQQPIGVDKGQHGRRIAPGQTGQPLRQFGAGLGRIACADSALGDDHPLADRIAFEHHRVAHEVTGSTQRVSWRLAAQRSLLHTLLCHSFSPPL